MSSAESSDAAPTLSGNNSKQIKAPSVARTILVFISYKQGIYEGHTSKCPCIIAMTDFQLQIKSYICKCMDMSSVDSHTDVNSNRILSTQSMRQNQRDLHNLTATLITNLNRKQNIFCSHGNIIARSCSSYALYRTYTFLNTSEYIHLQHVDCVYFRIFK